MNFERLKPHYTEIGDCWEWHGALQGGAVPCLKYKDDQGQWKLVAVRRWIAIQQGKKVKGRLATTTCDNPRCVCPDHVVLWTRKQLQDRNAVKVKSNITDAQRKKRSDNRRKQGNVKITLEQAREIRMSAASTREIAEKYGVTQKTAWLAKTGKTHRDFFNPFAGLIR